MDGFRACAEKGPFARVGLGASQWHGWIEILDALLGSCPVVTESFDDHEIVP